MSSQHAEFLLEHRPFIEAVVSNVGRLLAEKRAVVIEQTAHDIAPEIVAGAYTAEEARQQFPDDDEEGIHATVRYENRSERVQAAITALYCRGAFTTQRLHDAAVEQGNPRELAPIPREAVLPPEHTAVYRAWSSFREENGSTLVLRSTELKSPTNATLAGAYEVQQMSDDDMTSRLRITTIDEAPSSIHYQHAAQRRYQQPGLIMSDGGDDSRMMYQFLFYRYPDARELEAYVMRLRKATTGTYNRLDTSRILDGIYVRHKAMQSAIELDATEQLAIPSFVGVTPTPEELEEYIDLTSSMETL